MRTKELSRLEEEVMNVVWELKKCTVRDVQEKLSRSKGLAYTTVATILQRLHDKNLVTRAGNGQAYTYSPKLSKELYGKNVAQHFFQKFFSSFGDAAITSFAESLDKLPESKKKYLLKILSDNAK